MIFHMIVSNSRYFINASSLTAESPVHRTRILRLTGLMLLITYREEYSGLLVRMTGYRHWWIE